MIPASLGADSPDGWLWERIIPLAQAFNATAKIIFGSAIVPDIPACEILTNCLN